MTLHRLVLFVSLVLSPFSVATGAAAQYQSDPISPQAADRSLDTLTRVLAAALSNELHQQVVVDDRPRGALTLGLDLAAKMPPDGDFQPIAVVSRGQLPLAVSPKTPFHSMRELIDYAKQNPGKLLNASSSNGSPGHVGGELFKFMSGAQIVHVRYKGGSPAINDLIAGRVQVMFESLNSIARLRAQARALAVSGDLARNSGSADRRRGRRSRLFRAGVIGPAACRSRSSRRSMPPSIAPSTRRP